MAGLAYLLLPISGALAYFNGKLPRTRFHGIQAVILGILWPAALYGASVIGPDVTFIVAIAGALVWVTLMLVALFGRDLRFPFIGKALERLAAEPH